MFEKSAFFLVLFSLQDMENNKKSQIRDLRLNRLNILNNNKNVGERERKYLQAKNLRITQKSGEKR